MNAEVLNKYVPYSNEDVAWGLYVMDVGKMRASKGVEYPVGAHPSEYIFSFKNGRVLQEYQLLYINEGSGEFESYISGKLPVEAGSIIVLYPGIWHRYRPDFNVGWRESWVGFQGPIADHILLDQDFSQRNPVIKIGLHSRVNSIYDQILLDCNQGLPGYQQVVSGLVVELMGLIRMFRKTNQLNNVDIQSKIHLSRDIIEKKYDSSLDPKDIADRVGMGYSNFRKHFKLLTGFSPVQYIIHLRLRNAKELLYNTNFTIKEIAERIGFQSSYYFIRIFREKIGMTPRAFRMKIRGLS